MTARTDKKRKADADAAEHTSKLTKLSTRSHAKTTLLKSSLRRKDDADYDDTEKYREEKDEDSGAESTTDGPLLENSNGSIWAEKEKTYQVRVSLKHLSDTERLTLGIYQWASYVEVRVVLGGPQKPNPLSCGSKIRGFCIHLRSAVHDGGKSSRNNHKNLTMDKGLDPDKMFPACHIRDSSAFTHLLGKALYEELKESPSYSLERILSKASSLIGQPLIGKCIICNHVFETPSWGATTCSPACRTVLSAPPHQYYQISRLLADTDALDFLLCCVYTIVKKGTDLPGCELDNGTVRSILESFPALERSKTLPEILGVGKQTKSRRTLLLWLCKTFTGCIMSAPPAAQLPGMPKETRQILVLNVPNPALEHFHSSVQPRPSAPGFHVADASSILNILSHGFPDDTSISRSLTESLDSEKGPLVDWPQSQFLRSRIVFGVEAQFPDTQATAPSEQASSAELKGNTIMPRYILAFPDQRGSAWTSGTKAGITWTDRGKEIKATMVKTFEAIREGVMMSETKEEDSDVEPEDAEPKPQIEPDNEASEKEDTTSDDDESAEEQVEAKDSNENNDNTAPKPDTTTATSEITAKKPADKCETCLKHGGCSQNA